ncbi:MAG: hypothetical protein QNJ47_11240 [Nostocaceae cyanobacterium]|nr:hypothetical protein [Nostocaceae cyanobacterium]
MPANPRRAALRIRANASPVFLWADKLDENGQPLILLDEIDKRESITLPSAFNGIYLGAIYSQVTTKVNVDWTEYSGFHLDRIQMNLTPFPSPNLQQRGVRRTG